MFPCKRTRIKQEQLEHEVCGDAPGDAVDVAFGGHKWEGHAVTVSEPAPFPTSQRIGELDVCIDRLLQRLGPAAGVPETTGQEAAAIDVGSGQTQQQTLAADSGKARTQQARIDDLETALEHLHSRFTQVKSLPSPHAAAGGRSPVLGGRGGQQPRPAPPAGDQLSLERLERLAARHEASARPYG